MDKKTIAIIILSGIIILLIASIIIYFFLADRNKTEYDKKAEIFMNEIRTEIKNFDLSNDIQNKKILEMIKNKKPDIITNYITDNDLTKMTIQEKDKTIKGLQTDKENLKSDLKEYEKKLIEEMNTVSSVRKSWGETVDKLNDANKIIKNFKYSSWGISVNESITVNGLLNLNSSTNLIIKKYWLQGHFYIGGGPTLDIDSLNRDNKIIGGGVNFEIGGSF
jgi:hypothetical protein